MMSVMGAKMGHEVGFGESRPERARSAAKGEKRVLKDAGVCRPRVASLRKRPLRTHLSHWAAEPGLQPDEREPSGRN